MDNTATTVGALLFLEAKRASASLSDIMEVEYQAYTAACAYHLESKLPYIWTMTCFGSAARLWIFSAGDEWLTPFVPSHGGLGLPVKSEYLELSTHGREILDGLEYIKRHTTPSQELPEKTPSPRPVNLTLPDNWHDNEVVHVDALRQQQNAVPSSMAFDAMDHGAGSSSYATNQYQHGISYAFGIEPSVRTTGGEPQRASTGHFEAEVDQNPGPSVSRRGGGSGRTEVEVVVKRVSHKWKKDDLFFARNGQTQQSTEAGWVERKRNNETVWVYRHARKTDYWTRNLG